MEPEFDQLAFVFELPDLVLCAGNVEVQHGTLLLQIVELCGRGRTGPVRSRRASMSDRETHC